MSENDDREAMRQWVQRWKTVGPILEELRLQELPKVDTQQALMALAGAFKSALLHQKPEPTSGLIEQQALFMKLRKKDQSGEGAG